MITFGCFLDHIVGKKLDVSWKLCIDNQQVVTETKNSLGFGLKKVKIL